MSILVQIPYHHFMRYNACPKCTERKDKRAKMCQSCHFGPIGKTKTCTSCGVEKPTSEFRIHTRKNPRPRSHCKVCESEAQRERSRRPENKDRMKFNRRNWEKKNPKAHRRIQIRRRLRNKGCPENQLDQWIDRYLATTHCEICRELPQDRWKSLHVDHCHQSGTIRGLICGSCNFGLGKFKDDSKRLIAAAEYLMQQSAK